MNNFQKIFLDVTSYLHKNLHHIGILTFVLKPGMPSSEKYIL